MNQPNESWVRAATTRLRAQRRRLVQNSTETNASAERIYAKEWLGLRIKELKGAEKKAYTGDVKVSKGEPYIMKALVQRTKPGKTYTVNDYITILSKEFGISVHEKSLRQSLKTLRQRGELKSREIPDVHGRVHEWFKP